LAASAVQSIQELKVAISLGVDGWVLDFHFFAYSVYSVVKKRLPFPFFCPHLFACIRLLVIFKQPVALTVPVGKLNITAAMVVVAQW
jgi:hypothetical protein